MGARSGQVCSHLFLGVERTETVIVAALEGLERLHLGCHCRGGCLLEVLMVDVRVEDVVLPKREEVEKVVKYCEVSW